MKQYNNIKIQKELKYIHKLINNRRFEEAQKLIDELSFENSVNYAILFETGYLRFEERKFNEAYSIFESLTNRPNKNYALYYMAKIKQLEEKYDEAIEIFTSIVKLNYKNKDYALLELAKIEKYRENLQSALNYLNQIDSEETTLKNAKIIEEANIYYKQEEYEKSNQMIFEVIKKITEKNLLDKALITASLNYLKLQQYEESLKLINRVNNQTIQTKVIKAKNLFFQTKFISCSKLLEEANSNIEKQRNVNQFEIIIYLAKSYIKLGKIREALNLLEKNIDKYSELDYLIGVALFKDKKLEEARKKFMNVSKENDFYYYDSLKQLIYIDIKENKFEEAYEKFLILDKNKYFEKNENSKSLKNNIYLILSTKLELPKLSNSLYTTRQIYNYQIEVLKNYLKKSKNIEMELDEYLKIVSNNLNEQTYVENNLFDHYIIENPEKKFSQDYIKVLTIPNTKKIIFIHKSDKYGYDAYEIEEDTKKEIKSESQIEKFNKRYAKLLKK